MFVCRLNRKVRSQRSQSLVVWIVGLSRSRNSLRACIPPVFVSYICIK